VFGVTLAAAITVAAAAPVPHPRPGTPARQTSAGDGVSDSDMKKAVPLSQFLRQNRPTASDQYKTVSGELAKGQPALDSARRQSETLAAETARLQKKLIATADRIEFLESEKLTLDADVARLTVNETRLSAGFARDRVQVSRLLGILERLQHDMPPAMAVMPNDSLAAVRSAMLIGASLPRVYHDAAALAQRIEVLRQTRQNLIRRRQEAAVNAAALGRARVDLDRLLVIRRQQADAAAARYGVLKSRFDTLASQAVGLQSLLRKVALLRATPATNQTISTVNAVPRGKTWLLAPVVGPFRNGGVDGVGGNVAPGITFSTLAGATVIAPADGKIVFAGSFPKVGHVLILEIGAGYDAVLAGMDRLNVRSNDAVLAGEPVGFMPNFDHEPRLYFELRQKGGKGTSPAPLIAVTLRKAR